MITFRVIQGAGAAIMFPAALAIVIASFPPRERGRALAIFFGIAGGAEEGAQQVGGAVGKVVESIPHDFALATQTVFYAFAAVMAVAFVVALVAMPSGKVEEQVEEPGAEPLAGAG